MLDRLQHQASAAPWTAGRVTMTGTDKTTGTGSVDGDRARRFRDAALPHLDDVFTLARYLMRNAADAEDAVQECYLRALRHFDSYRGPTMKPWLLAILKNVCVAEFARRREQFVHDLNGVPGFRCEAPEGAFYAWVDIRGTGATAEEICRILLEDAGVAAIPGAAFGPAGKDFVRFSFASSVANLREAVARIAKVSSAWQGTLAEK